MINKILNEITNFCEECGSREQCPEKECVLFRIEKIIEQTNSETEVERAKMRLANWAVGIDFDAITDEKMKEKIVEEVKEAIWIVLAELDKNVTYIPLNLLGGNKDGAE